MTFPRMSQTGRKAGRLESWFLSPCGTNAKVELGICQFLMAEIVDRNSAPSIPRVGEQQAKTTNQDVMQGPYVKARHNAALVQEIEWEIASTRHPGVLDLFSCCCFQ